jgi:2-hydroxychromene-2-carboxylate isomerase
MAAEIEFLFDFGSPTAYLAFKRLPAVVARSGAVVRARPILLGGVFKATGNQPPGVVAAKGRWMAEDLQRFARRYGCPFAMNPAFPVNTLNAMRVAAALEEDEAALAAYMDSAFAAMWVDQRSLADPAELSRAIERAGLDAAATLTRAGEEEAKTRLKRNTEEAVARGVFGAPSFFVDGALFFGQDRLDFVEEAALAAV